MNSKKMIVALLVALVMIPAAVSAGTISAKKNEQVVEGHTVFAVFERTPQAWAVAGLVRDYGIRVLWFNDQYLVGEEARYPCGGWVFAVPQGAPTPFGVRTSNFGLTTQPATFSAAGRYRVTDPNDFEWHIDSYSYTTSAGSARTWVVPVLNSNIVDNGVDSCQPIVDAPPAGYLDPGLNGYCYSGGQYFDDGAQRCGPVTASCPGIADGYPDPATAPGTSPPVNTVPNGLDPVCDWPRLYNFVIVGYFNHLVRSGTKDHGCDDTAGDGSTCVEGNPDYGADAGDKNGCEEGPYQPDAIQYDCVDEDGAGTGDPHSAADPADDNEGNSHPYNPCACESPRHEHGTARIDLYFSSTFRPPALTGGFSIDDTVGSTAPFHNHQGASAVPNCPPGWINPGGGGYPGAPTPYC